MGKVSPELQQFRNEPGADKNEQSFVINYFSSKYAQDESTREKVGNREPHKEFGIDDATNWKESAHPRGQPGNAGQFGSGGGGGKKHAAAKSEQSGSEQKSTNTGPSYKPGLAAHGLDASDKKKKEWAAASPIKTIDDLFAQAPANQTALGKVGDALAAKYGVRFANPGVKGRARTQEKVDQGKIPARINDVVRGGFSINTPAEGDAIVKELAEHFEVADEGWAVTPTGYFDRKVMVRFPEGQVGEVQIWHPDLLRDKEEKGHKIYEEWRSLPYGDPRRAELENAQKEIYSKTFAGLAPEWKALFGKGANDGNLESNLSFDSTAADMATSIDGAGIHLPSRKHHASPGRYNVGSPSHEQNLTFDISAILASHAILCRHRIYAADVKIAKEETGDEKFQLAFDKMSVREFDADGRLHVAVTHISKATVNPYLGHEIPGWEMLGLDPNKIYWLLRDPEELRKAAPTFNGIPVLNQHMPVTAEEHPKEFVIGSTGNDAEFDGTYLNNSLSIWPMEDITGIESEQKKELSSAYRYAPIMEPGIFQGKRFDGRMTQIVGNHVAVVKEGRAGPDVIVGDSIENIQWHLVEDAIMECVSISNVGQ